MFKLPFFSLICLICLLATLCFVFAQESLTITTYYPSPYGSYNQLTTNQLNTTGNTTLATNAGSVVGIGTTTPTNILSLGNASAQKFWIENTATGTVGRALTIAAGGTVAGTTDITGGNLILQSGLGTGTGASTISFQTGTTLTTGTTLQTMSTKMTILGNGNVGIGTPGGSWYRLEVLSPAGSTALNAAGTFYGNSGTSLFWGDTSPLGALSYTAGPAPLVTTPLGGTRLGLGVSGMNEYVSIWNTGRVGIGTGTTAPQDKLHISVSDAGTNTVLTSLRQERLTSGVAAAGLGVAQEFWLENAAGTSVRAAKIDVVWDNAASGSENAFIRFSQMVTGTGLFETMRIGPGQNVGIGTTTLTDRLTVGGNVVPSTDNVATCGKSGQRWSAVWAANGTIQTCFLAYKNITAWKPFEDYLLLVPQPIQYTWKSGADTREHLGYIGDHLPKIAKVSEDGIEEKAVVAILCGAIKQLEAKVEELETKVAKLKL